jgi:hypothetical protein
MDNFDPLILHVKRVAKNLNMEYVGEILRPAVYSLDMKKGDSDAIGGAMGAFERAGKELVENGVVSQKTRQKAASEIAPGRHIFGPSIDTLTPKFKGTPQTNRDSTRLPRIAIDLCQNLFRAESFQRSA